MGVDLDSDPYEYEVYSSGLLVSLVYLNQNFSFWVKFINLFI